MASAQSTNPSLGGAHGDEIHEGMLHDRELLAYLAGDADGATATHLANCPTCQARLAELRALEQRLTKGLFRVECPPSLTLGDYHLGFLSAAETRTIAAHVKQCPHCTQELATLQSYLSVVAPSIESEPTPSLLTRARIVVAQLAEELSNWGGLGGLTAASAGVRGTAGEQLVYTVEELGDDVQVILDVQADSQNPAQRALFGLMLGLPAPQAFAAHLWHAELPAATTPVDELGNFVLTGLTPGTYDLILSGGDAEVHLQTLTI